MHKPESVQENENHIIFLESEIQKTLNLGEKTRIVIDINK